MKVEIRNMICAAPWCHRPTAASTGQSARQINSKQLCRACYQYVWEQAKLDGKEMGEIFSSLPPPKKTLPAIKTKCARKGCDVKFEEGNKGQHRRHIGLHHVCRNCYEATWEWAKRRNIPLEKAFAQLPEKGWHKNKPPKYSEVDCGLPWCKNKVLNKAKFMVAQGVYVCGGCRLYLHGMNNRFKCSPCNWKERAIQAIQGQISAPGELEKCSMPWCQAMCKCCRNRGPNGEPICPTDSVYLHLYAKRKKITFLKAFLSAPPPKRRGPERSIGWPKK
ncbi:MAG: hypothetical protein KBC48_00130 [Candidatus Pacebacteria bacterium]|nr:hypothetical protein [Candidatus Paceibacterota bacterium]